MRDEHEAHDAFQATFLVLVNKARSLWVRDSLGPWLHEVAFRVALCARSSSARRRKHERCGGEWNARNRSEGGAWVAGELETAIHEEIARLPERYRAPVVLCDLEGWTHEQAARSLGWPVGTVKSRQARGRDRLRLRLIRRGLAPSAGLGVLFGAEANGATLAPTLMNATAHTATLVAAGLSTSEGGAIPARVAALSKEVLMGFSLNQWKLAALSLLAIAAATACAWGVAARAPGDMPGEGQAPAEASGQAAVDPPRERPGEIT